MKHVRKITSVKVLEATAAVDFANTVLNAYYGLVYGKKNFIIGDIIVEPDPDDDTDEDDTEELFPGFF